MGNFHCVPSGCAEVVYQEYLAPKIRYRYPGEQWKEVLGADDYSLTEQKKYCSGIPYRLFYSTAVISNGTLSGWTSSSTGLPALVSTNAPYTNIRLIAQGIAAPYNIQYFYGTPVFHWAFRFAGINPNGSRNRIYQVVVDSVNYQNQTILTATPAGLRIDAIEPDGTQYSCPPDCVFKVTKNGAVVYQETRSVCPEVEKIPCRISSEIKRIEIEKFPWLERVEVVDYAYDVRLGGLIDSDNYGLFLSKKAIPNECLNIYKNSITSIIPNDFFSITNTPENGFNLITQICSAPGCLPPQYQVLCDSCECESCPDGTHPISCSGYVCCYGSDGKVVKQIPIDNYCGEDCCCE